MPTGGAESERIARLEERVRILQEWQHDQEGLNKDTDQRLRKLEGRWAWLMGAGAGLAFGAQQLLEVLTTGGKVPHP